MPTSKSVLYILIAVSVVFIIIVTALVSVYFPEGSTYGSDHTFWKYLTCSTLFLGYFNLLIVGYIGYINILNEQSNQSLTRKNNSLYWNNENLIKNCPKKE